MTSYGECYLNENVCYEESINQRRKMPLKRVNNEDVIEDLTELISKAKPIKCTVFESTDQGMRSCLDSLWDYKNSIYYFSIGNLLDLI